jgi:hypothetical protein
MELFGDGLLAFGLLGAVVNLQRARLKSLKPVGACWPLALTTLGLVVLAREATLRLVGALV